MAPAALLRSVPDHKVAPQHRPDEHLTASLQQVAHRVRPTSLAREHVLPVAPVLSGLLPGGLPRGATVAIGSADRSAVCGATSLALALLAGPSEAGSWAVAVGMPALGLAAAAEAGVALERFAVIAAPPSESWSAVVAALVGAFDVVMVAPTHRVRAAEARQLVARARERGTVLVQVTQPFERTARTLPLFQAELRFTVIASRWQGVGAGHGHLRSRFTTIELDGRRGAARPRRCDLWLPDRGTFTATAVSTIDSFAGSDVDHLVAARRERVRRVATAPLAPRAHPDRPLSEVG